MTLVSAYDPYPPEGADDRHLGGVERVFARFAEGLSLRGHEVTIVCSGARQHESRAGDVTVRRIRPRGTLLRAPVVDLRKHIPEDTDLVHVAATYPFVTPGVIRHARRNRLPCVLDFHFEPDPVTWPGRVAARLYQFVGPPSYSQADHVLVRSHDYAHHAPSLRHVAPGRLTALPNGVDGDRFSPHGPREGDGNLLFVGRLVPYKGLDTLLHALAMMTDPPPLWIVGDGPLRPRLQVTASRLGVPIRFLGRVPDERLPSLYRGARLTVLPSVGRQECFGISLLESMACGTPVVASDLPGVRAVARRGGRTAPAGDPGAWARILQETLDGPTPDPHALAERVHAECSWDAVVDRLQTVYHKVVAA